MSNLNDLPSEKSGSFLARTRESLQTLLGARGDWRDRAVRLGELVDNKIVRLEQGQRIGMGRVSFYPGEAIEIGATGPAGPAGPPGVGVEDPDLTPPPAPGGITATAAITHVLVEVPAATYTQGHGHLRTRLYGAQRAAGAPVPTFSDAVEVGQFSGTVWALASNPGTTWHLWAKWETRDGVLSASPAGGANGVVATTGQDVASLVRAMTGTGNPFKVVASEIMLPDGSVVPPGFYAADGYLHNGIIVNAMVANLAVDNAKIANVSVGKLTAGSIAVGEYIQSSGYVAGTSGWRIDGSGNAEFSGVVVRGAVFASQGQVGGSTIGSNYIRSTNYVLNQAGWNLQSDGTGQIGGFAVLANAVQSSNFVAGSAGWRLHRDGTLEANSGTFRGNVAAGQFTTGAMTGYAWPAAGNYGTYLGPSGLLIGNANNSKYLQVTADGNLYAPGMSIVNGVLSISQANVITALNLAGNAVSVSNFASGNNGASTNVTIPAGVTATVFALATKGVGAETSGGTPPTNMTLSIGGVPFSASVWPTSRQTEFSGTLNAYDQCTLSGQVTVSGPTTVSISVSFPVSLSNPVSVFALARWK